MSEIIKELDLKDIVDEYLSDSKVNNIRRNHSKGIRWYKKNGLEWKPSVTSVLQCVSKGVGFEKWLGDQPSYKEACDIRDKSASLGTNIHNYIEEYNAGTLLDLDKEDEQKYMMSYEAWYDTMCDEQGKSIFVNDNFVQEIFLYNEDMPWAGTPDLVIRSSEAECVLIDYKTGNPYKTHEIQLNMYRELWNSIFPEFPVTKIFSLYLKSNWKIKPTFNFKEYKKNPHITMAVHVLWEYLNKPAKGSLGPRKQLKLKKHFSRKQ